MKFGRPNRKLNENSKNNFAMLWENINQDFPERQIKKSDLLNVLVYGYLCEVNPTLAIEFVNEVDIVKTLRTSDFPTLRDIVVHFCRSNRMNLDVKVNSKVVKEVKKLTNAVLKKTKE